MSAGLEHTAGEGRPPERPLAASPAPASAPARRFLSALLAPPRWLEVLLWVVVIATVIGMRLYLIHLLPVGLWSKDAGSYAYSAFRWVHTGVWETDPRRGPVYSMLIALCGKTWGDIDSLMMVQHALGAISILLGAFALRLMHGRAGLLPLCLCGFAYGTYGLPLYLEHLVRNETLLFFFGSVSLLAWLLAILRHQPHWLWLTGAAAALLSVTKNVWLPFPILFIAATGWYFRPQWRYAGLQVGIFILAFAVPYLGIKSFKKHTLSNRVDEPQEGILLYGRTAQFTRLDGGIYPDLKKEIRPEVEAYQKEVFGNGKGAPRLNNNEILKKTVVPLLHSLLLKQGKTTIDLNNICKQLAVEAIEAHPVEYAEQMGRDLLRLNLNSGTRFKSPNDSDLESQRALLLEIQGKEDPDPLIQIPRTLAVLDRIQPRADGSEDDAGGGTKHKRHAVQAGDRFAVYHTILDASWMFDLAPVLLTSLLVPVVFFLAPIPLRAWWLGAAGLWYFTMVLLATVGRPLDRYLIPALPVMFLTLSSAVTLLWIWLVGRFAGKPVALWSENAASAAARSGPAAVSSP